MGVSSAAAAPAVVAVVGKEAEADSEPGLAGVGLAGRQSSLASELASAGSVQESRPVMVVGGLAEAAGPVVAAEAVTGPELDLVGLADHAGSAVAPFDSAPRQHSGLAAPLALLAHSFL